MLLPDIVKLRPPRRWMIRLTNPVCHWIEFVIIHYQLNTLLQDERLWYIGEIFTIANVIATRAICPLVIWHKTLEEYVRHNCAGTAINGGIYERNGVSLEFIPWSNVMLCENKMAWKRLVLSLVWACFLRPNVELWTWKLDGSFLFQVQGCPPFLFCVGRWFSEDDCKTWMAF